MVDVRSSLRCAVLLIVGLACGAARAEEGDSNFKLSGFMSLVGGRILNGDIGPNYTGPASVDGIACPCYTADWSNAGVYQRRLSLEPESRAGIQGKYTFTPELNAVVQVVTRGSDPAPNVQWAYLSYAASKHWEVQVGRKRIPLYFYSDFQDIGVSYPWVSVPPELYGWEATNYNGASVRYRGNVGETNLSASAFGGRETVNDSLYQKLFYDGRNKVVWSKLVGGDLELDRGILTTRLVYIQADVATSNPDLGQSDSAKLRAYGIAANLDLDQWFVLSELTQLTRDFQEHYRVTAPAFTVGAGYHWGNWTPFLNYASYKEKSSNLDLYLPQSYKRSSLTLRYDVDTKSDVKLQYDRHRDVTNNFGGDATLLRLAYDRLF